MQLSAPHAWTFPAWKSCLRRATEGVAAVAMAWLLHTGSAQARDLPDFADLVEKAGPAVVNIRTTERAPDGLRLPLRRRAPSLQPDDEVARGEGSGFLLSPDGLLMTNAHVIAGAAEVYVTLTDKREFKAKIIGADERTDIALVKIDASGLPYLRVGDVSRLRVGEWVLAIGSPFGLENSVTAGIVSAKQRETGSDVPFIQTDVAVNPGNSGGPLINVRGEVVGINSQILSPVGSFVGVSFAIPIDEAMRIANQIKASGRVVRGYLGIQLTDLPRDLPEEYGLAKSRGQQGAFVRHVFHGGPAEKGGVLPGDVILLVNGKPFDGALELRRMLGLMKPGSTVALQVNRRGRLLELKADLAETESSVAAGAVERPGPADLRRSTAAKVWGLTVEPLGEPGRLALQGAGGVRVAAVSAGAAAVGLRVGDTILAVGAVDVFDVGQFDAAVAKMDKTRPLPLTALRGEWAQFVRVPVLK